MQLVNHMLFTSFRSNTIRSIRLYFRRASTSLMLPKILRFINKNLYSLGLGASLNRYDNSVTFYSSFEDKRLYSDYKSDSKFINFGSGAFYHNRWKNYDYPGQSEYYKSIQGKSGKDFYPINLCDKNLAVPEADNTVELIYCAHTLEHLDFGSALRFLEECFRILKKNGVMRIALPNTKNHLLMLQYVANQGKILREIELNYRKDAARHILSDTENLPLENVKEKIYEAKFNGEAFYSEIVVEHPDMAKFDKNKPERHITYWDFNKLIETAQKIGFSSIIPTYQGSSVAKPFCNLHVFDTSEPHIAFYADIVKL